MKSDNMKSDIKITNDVIVNLALAIGSINEEKSKQNVSRYSCGKNECLCQKCVNSKEDGFGRLPKNDSCWCYRDKNDEKEYFDDITPCKNGGVKQCPYLKSN